MKIMIGRIQASAREYPLFTLLVVFVYLGGAMLTPVLFAGNTLGSVLRWTGVGLLAVFALDILSYIWIVADDGRVRWFTEMVNDYEGKSDVTLRIEEGDEDEDCGECEIEEEDEDRSL